MTVNRSRVSGGIALAAVIATFAVIGTAQGARPPVDPGGQIPKGSSHSTWFCFGCPLSGNTHVRRPFDTDPD